MLNPAHELYCPHCNGWLGVVEGPVITVHRHSTYGWHIDFKVSRFLSCLECPLVSEVDMNTGTLVDLGNVNVRNIMAPFVPGIDTDRSMILQQPTGLHGRKDS